MNTISKCLFGGALLGAGLSSPATGGDVVWGAGSSLTYAIGDYQNNIGSGNWNLVSTSSNGTSASSVGNNLGLSIFALGIIGNTGSAYVYKYFTVTHDMLIHFEWDFRFVRADMEISDSMGNILFYQSNPSFSFVALDLSFMAGETYRINGSLVSLAAQPLSFTMTGGSDINVVPIPPAAFGGLAMLAGLGAYRRIRR